MSSSIKWLNDYKDRIAMSYSNAENAKEVKNLLLYWTGHIMACYELDAIDDEEREMLDGYIEEMARFHFRLLKL